MLEVYKNNTAFLHIHKTAGTSTREFLVSKYGRAGIIKFTHFKLGTRHHTLTELKEAVDVYKFDKIFTTIRNPYDRAVSLYFWIKRAISDLQQREAFENVYPEYITLLDYEFDEYINWFVENEPLYADYLLINGQLPKNLKFIKFENIKEDLEKEFNCKVNLACHMKTEHKPFVKYYNKSTSGKIYNAEKWAFDFFKYPNLLKGN